MKRFLNIKLVKKSLAAKLFLLTFIVIIGLCGCSENTETPQTADAQNGEINSDVTTLSWYVNYSWFSAGWGENMVSKAITDKTGVAVEFVVPSGNEDEKLMSLINGDNLPDILTIGWWDSAISELLSKNMVYPLDELADEYEPLFWKVVNDEVVEWYTSEDGHIYQYPNSSYTVSDYEKYDTIASNQTFLVRKDIYEAIGSPDMTTPEGFINAVKEAERLYPTIEGEDIIPIGSHVFTQEGCDSFDKYLQNFLAVPYLDEDGNFYDRYTDEDYISWLKTFRQLYEEGYLKDEIFLDNRTQMEEKIAKGQYFCMLYQRSDLADQELSLYSKDPDKIYIAVDGPRNSNGDDYKLPAAGINGWTVTLISKKCENPDKAIELITYLISEEGQLMTWFGVEGEMWDYNAEGKPQMHSDVAQLLSTNRTEFDKQYGSDSCYWMLQNNAMMAGWQDILDEPLGQMQSWAIPYTIYTAQYDVIFEENSEASSINSKINQLWGQTLPRLLVAGSDEEFDQILEDYKSKRDDYGYEKYKEEASKKVHENMKKLGME